MDLQRVGAIFQCVFEFRCCSRQFARLAQRDETRIQTIGDRRAEDESARFHAQHQVDAGFEIMFGERIDQHGQAEPVLEQGGDVVKQDALLGEIGNFADQFLQRLAVQARAAARDSAFTRLLRCEKL